MRSILFKSVILITLLFAACSAGHSELKKSLSSAVKDNKVSALAMEKILEEHEMLREEDRKNARTFADQVITALKMGADSSHLDVIRRRFIKERDPDIRV